jgi:hypothetical protein
MKFSGFPMFALAVPLVAGTADCKKSEAATTADPAKASTVPAPKGPDCPGHAACATSFFVDAVAPASCAVGSSCSLTLKLVALGDYHVNDEYPYRFKADDAPAVRFEGTDAAGKNVFSKPAGDWQKSDPKSGTMIVKFSPLQKGATPIAGTFKLSVCSAQNCLLEQPRVSALVLVR